MMISLALNDVYVTLHSENSTEHSHCGWPGKCFLFVFLFPSPTLSLLALFRGC